MAFVPRGDWTRWNRYFGLAVQPFTSASVTSVTFNTAGTGLTWSQDRNRFQVGPASGVSAADIIFTVSADPTLFTLSFAPGSFAEGEAFRFGMSVFEPVQGTTQELPDRFGGMAITVKMSDGKTYTDKVAALPAVKVNRFTGAGLVNAQAATSGGPPPLIATWTRERRAPSHRDAALCLVQARRCGGTVPRMRCPVCEAENVDDAAECGTCGRALAGRGGGDAEVAAIDGLEMTQLAPPDLVVPIQPLPGVEHTRLEEDGGGPPQWTAGPLPLERTRHEVDEGTSGSWTGEVEIDPGRETETGERTPLPAETAVCPWCGTPSLDAVCGNCGRRKLRYMGPPPAEARRAASGESVTCPACFARVAKEVRCSECGMPFPLQEL